MKDSRNAPVSLGEAGAIGVLAGIRQRSVAQLKQLAGPLSAPLFDELLRRLTQGSQPAAAAHPRRDDLAYPHRTQPHAPHPVPLHVRPLLLWLLSQHYRAPIAVNRE
jgi:hypothetical protein